MGGGPAAIDLTWRVHAPTAAEAETEAKHNLEWLLGNTWSVELTGKALTLQSFQSDELKSGRLAGWWDGLTSSQQKQALVLEHHSVLPDWTAATLTAAGITVVAGRWAEGEAPVQFLVPREVSEYLDRRRHSHAGGV